MVQYVKVFIMNENYFTLILTLTVIKEDSISKGIYEKHVAMLIILIIALLEIII